MSSAFLFSKNAECFGILAPPIAITLLVLLVDQLFPGVVTRSLPTWGWLVVVVGIDVAHVWSTIFRTYLSPGAYVRFPRLLFLAPLCAWLLGVALYSSLGGPLFWSCFAYLAVFHFVRQQYGLHALYARRCVADPLWIKELNIAAVYLSALYPLLYWHGNLPREFHWFVDGDFTFTVPRIAVTFVGWLFVVVLVLHLAVELTLWKRGYGGRLAKNLVIWGTAVSWYVGIVFFNADVPFTLTNIVTHGIPYFTLIWLYERNERVVAHDGASALALRVSAHRSPSFVDRVFTSTSKAQAILGVCAFVAVTLSLACIEEWAWDVLIWRDHYSLFGFSWGIPPVTDPKILALLVPLLSLPQATHYIVDGFIWRTKKG